MAEERLSTSYTILVKRSRLFRDRIGHAAASPYADEPLHLQSIAGFVGGVLMIRSVLVSNCSGTWPETARSTYKEDERCTAIELVPIGAAVHLHKVNPT